jgi:hypothetical protein
MRRPAVWCMHQTEQLHPLSFGTERARHFSAAGQAIRYSHIEQTA